MIGEKLEQNVRNHIFNTWMGEQPIGSAFVLPYVEPVEATTETRVSSSKREKHKGGDDGASSKKLVKRSTPTKPIGKVASFVCWVCIGRKPTYLSRDASYNGAWAALHAIKQYNKSIAAAAVREIVTSSKKDKHGTLGSAAMTSSPSSTSSSSSAASVARKKLTKVILFAPIFGLDSVGRYDSSGSLHLSLPNITVGTSPSSSSSQMGGPNAISSSGGNSGNSFSGSSGASASTHATKSEASVSVFQTSLAIKNFMAPSYEPLDEEAVERLNQSLLGGRASISTQEREKELDGLLFSRELESRGLCNEEELDILINWVNATPSTSSSSGGSISNTGGSSSSLLTGVSGGNQASWLGGSASDALNVSKHALSAAKALVSLLRRPDTEFTLRSEQICERVISKSSGCLQRLLEMGQNGDLELHREIARSELEIGGKVGDGNAGSVYRAKWKGIDVAVKMFTKGSVQNSQDFIRELSLLSLIQHPLIVNCFGGSSKPGDEYIVEELMEASVYDLLHDKKFEMDAEMRLDFAISTAKCMHFLHSCGVIHRDLKSLNLLVSKTYQVKVCDFGLSRVIDSKNQMTSNIGTVSWVAPELFAKKLYTEKADVYSYGIILWELVTRQMPFGDIEAFSVPLMVSRGERPDLPKDLQVEWRKLIKSCWHQKPASRPTFKKVLVKLRLMLQTLRDEKKARGEQIGDRGLFIRNSQFLLEEEGSSPLSPLGAHSTHHRTSGGGGMFQSSEGDSSKLSPYSSSAPHRNSDSKSDSEYSSENMGSSYNLSTLSISATSLSASSPGNAGVGAAPSKKEKKSKDKDKEKD